LTLDELEFIVGEFPFDLLLEEWTKAGTSNPASGTAAVLDCVIGFFHECQLRMQEEFDCRMDGTCRSFREARNSVNASSAENTTVLGLGEF
jgi:hypothetical protein